jgi:hypothetical protein
MIIVRLSTDRSMLALLMESLVALVACGHIEEQASADLVWADEAVKRLLCRTGIDYHWLKDSRNSNYLEPRLTHRT